MKPFLFYLSIFLLVACKKEQVISSDAAEASSTGLLINEILPNPRKDGAEFIELYNPTEQIFDLKNFQLARINDDSLSSAKAITNQSIKFLPQTYTVITKDPAAVLLQYHTENPQAFVAMNAFPALPNTGGTIALLRGDSIIDRLDYNEHMHNPFIKNTKGISLERRSTKESTNNLGNFTSASAASGYATPGFQNSQFQDTVLDQEGLWLPLSTFSPDNDSYADLLQIHYQFNQGGHMLTMHIFNDHSIQVRKLYDNYLLGAKGTLDWDGRDDAQQRLPVGIYMIYAEIYNTTEGIRRYRLSCVLATKF